MHVCGAACVRICKQSGESTIHQDLLFLACMQLATMSKLTVFIVAMELLYMQANANRLRRFNSSTPDDTPHYNSSSTTSTPARCLKTWVDVPVNSTRQGCSQGILTAVPVCAGACNSFSVYTKSFPYKSSYCSCCQPTVYRMSERKVDFVCNGHTETVAFHVAAVVSCDCSACGLV